MDDTEKIAFLKECQNITDLVRTSVQNVNKILDQKDQHCSEITRRKSLSPKKKGHEGFYTVDQYKAIIKI